MTKYIFILAIVFTSTMSFSQKDTIIDTEKEFEMVKNMPSISELEQEEKIFIHVENMPKFPGGVNALRRYIGQNVNYPSEARENGIQGIVYIRFQVKKDGSIGIVEIQKGVHEIIDKEAVKVIKSLPNFTPGTQNGKPQSVWYSIPVTFRLG